MGRYLLATCLALTSLAQDQLPRSDVRVTVVDALSQRPVDSATVTVVSPGAPGPAPGVQPVSRTGETSFSLPRGRNYFLSVKASGYSGATKQFTATDEKHTFTLTLSKFAKLTGTLVDADTEAPLQNIKIGARKLRYFHGVRQAQGIFQNDTTDKQGHFILERLEAGDYVLETTPSIHTPATATTPDRGYPRRDWPGGGGIADASPLRVLPGSDQNVGTIRLRQTTLYRLTLRPGGPLCAPDQSYRVELTQTSRVSSTTLAQQTVPCGTAATFTTLSPDAYDVKLRTSLPEGLAFETVRIVKENLTTTLQLLPPATITGRVLLDSWDKSRDAKSDDTATAPIPPGISLKLFPRNQDSHQTISPVPVFTPVGVTPEGAWSGPVYIPSSGRIDIQPFGLPEGYSIGEIRVNGRISPGREFQLDPFAPTAQVDVLLTPTARLEGTLHDCTCTGRVFAIPVPLATADAYPIGTTETAATAGRFTFPRLRPGKYALVAVPDTDPNDDRLEEPGRLLSLANSAKVIEVETSRTTNAEVTISVY